MNITLATQEGRWETIHIGEESFEALITPPTFEQKMTDRALLASSSETERVIYRIKTAVADWRGLNVTKDGKEEALPFTWENLEAVCANYPEAADWLHLHAHRAFEGTTEKKPPTSEPGSSDSAEDDTTKQS